MSENPFIPPTPANGESYGAYLDRLEAAVIAITALTDPPVAAIQALAFVAMEAPADFDSSCYSKDVPSHQMRKFLAKLPEQLRAEFRRAAMELPRGRDDRINMLLTPL